MCDGERFGSKKARERPRARKKDGVEREGRVPPSLRPPARTRPQTHSYGTSMHTCTVHTYTHIQVGSMTQRERARERERERERDGQ